MSTDFISFCERYRKMERARLRRIEAPNEIMSRPSWYAAMMVQYGYADGIVGGNITLPAAYFRALLHLIKRMPGLDSASSCVPVTLTDRRDLGSDGTIFLADCAVVPSPTVSQLANAAVETARCAGQLLRIRPRVAMISFSTRGSARSESTQRVVAATELARERARRQFVEMDIDGELEVDAAIQPEVAMSKAPQSILGGRANVLVFPDLNSAHSAFKLIEIVGRARSAGQQVLGLVRPAAQVSRVCSGQTIFSAAITTAVRAGAFRDWINSEPES